MLKIHNSLTRDKQTFVPIEPGRVRMYVCGMTVYDDCHLGHARMLLSFDMVYRWLQASAYDVTYVRNITDIDDKIIARAAENKESIGELTKRMVANLHRDTERLLMLPPTFEPRATEHIPGMVALIEKLIGNGLAYPAANGDVYYAVAKFPGYGKLSGKTLSDLRAGERIEIDPHKRDPLDFVLWKAAKPGEPSWPSPWGQGRPGWHIECSVMSEYHLGQHFDIHGGGHDLQFPHHENEIAQSEGAHGHNFVNYWMHNGFLRFNDEKMSKSLGNFFKIDDVVKVYDPEVLRFFILRAHYRSPLNYTEATLADAKHALDRLYTALKENTAPTAAIDWNEPAALRFREAMDDDFNTPEAVAVLFELANEANRSRSQAAAALLKALGGTLGLLQRDPHAYLQAALVDDGGLNAEQIEAQIAARAAAKKAKNFAEADRLRAELLVAGITLEDSAQGTTWRRT
ncbi:MAG: cysteine--tRNA ligase [Sterolibacterium sp.]|nr:cysteine--tRNA ligase [Sterolibacterium sp.]